MIDRAAVDGSFADALAEFRERGSAMLACGTPPEETTTRMCRRLLGQRGDQPHDRLPVATEPAATERLAADAPGRADLVDGVALARSAAAGPTPPDPESGAAAGAASVERTAVEADSLSALGAASDRVAALAASEAARGAPCRRRVSGPAVRVPRPRGRLPVRSLARRAGPVGRGHVPRPPRHGARPRARPPADPLFDVVVELRQTSAGAQHRWHLSDREPPTAWLALDAEPQTGE